MLRRPLYICWHRRVPYTSHVPRQPKYLLQAKSPGRRLVHQSRCVVVHFQHLGHESRGEATVGLLRFLFITTSFLGFRAAGYNLLSFVPFYVGYGCMEETGNITALRRRSWVSFRFY